MATATMNGVVIAESESTVMVEGNHYFPPEAVKMQFFAENPKTTVCPWKGTASYFDVTVNGVTSKATAWVYRQPKEAAAEIRDHIAFWGDVRVTG